jgi:hypothetical protein
MFLQDLTPEPILEEIWYGSRRATPNRCTYLHFSEKKLGETRSELF